MDRPMDFRFNPGCGEWAMWSWAAFKSRLPRTIRTRYRPARDWLWTLITMFLLWTRRVIGQARGCSFLPASEPRGVLPLLWLMLYWISAVSKDVDRTGHTHRAEEADPWKSPLVTTAV